MGAVRDAASKAAGSEEHSIDLTDLYADAFGPALTAAERRYYFDVPHNREGLEDYVARLKSAEAIVLQFSTGCFGPPRC
jgi:NAD(P)H dehydrogenase (quinone)